MATLYNTKISATYEGLIKTIDNAVINATLKELTDGSGNTSGIFMNTGGDFKVTSILEFGSLKDTGENITISKFVDAADGIGNNDNDTTIPTTAAIINYVAGQITAEDLDFRGDDATVLGDVDLNSEAFIILGTANEIETSVTAAGGNTLKIGIVSNPVLTGIVTATTFSGDLNGTINTATTATTQTAGDNSTKVATTAYVDTLDAASDLDFSGDSGTGDVNLNTQVFAVTGTTNQIVTAASNQGLSFSLPATVHRNLQGNVTGNVQGDLTGNVTATSVLANGVTATTQASSDSSTKVATTAYVKGLDNASDLDITGDTGTGDVNLNTQTLNILGTTNEITTAVVNQTATISLPSSISVNVVGNVTGDLTGNADTATKWQTPRDLSLTGQATGTMSSVDGTLNVSGAVTLDNNSVTGKVLTGLPTPAAATVLPTDSILEAFGKMQSQINAQANGLQFQGSWDATNNTPILGSGGGEANSGTTTSTATNKLIQTGQNFTSTVTIGDKVINQVDRQTALVTNIDSNTTLSLDADIMLSGEDYTIDNSPFIVQGHYYVVNVGGTTQLNGISEWSVGDWVIAGANNEWTKLDHTDVEGVGTSGNIAKWIGTGTIADSIISESGAAITVTGTLATTSSLTAGSNFDVATDKFTANATTGNVAFPGDLAINTDKFTVNATSGNTVVGGDLSLSSGYLNVTTDGSVAYGMIINSADQSHSRIRINNTGSGGNAWSIMSGTSGVSNDGFAIRNETTTTTALQFTNSGNATFAGDVTTSGDIELNGANKYIYLRTGTNSGLWQEDNFSLRFGTNNVEALTINSSQNATFAGDVTINGAEYINQIQARTGAGLSLGNDNNSGFVFIDDNSNVGISTTSPDFKLQIQGGTNTEETVLKLDKQVTGDTGGHTTILGFGTETGAWAKAGIGFERTGSYDRGKIHFLQEDTATTDTATLSDSVMTINNLGNVGIGTTSPTVFSGYTTVAINNATQGGILELQSNGTSSLRLACSTSDSALWEPRNVPVLFATNNTERMRIDSSGNVMIGGTTTFNGVTGETGFEIYGNTAQLLINNPTYNWFTIYSASDSNIYNVFGSSGNYLIGTGNKDTSSWSEKMRIDSSGNSTFAGNVRISKTDATLEINNSTGSLTNADLYISVEDTGQADVRHYGAYPLAFWTNNVQRLTIDADGDVYNYQSVNNANTNYGFRAGRYAATGASNSFYGYTTGQSLTSGTGNAGIGRSALKNITTGSNNVGIGIEALQELTVGSSNVAIGRAAGTLGDFSESVFVGALAGYQNNQGATVGIGNEALKNNTAVDNTGVGHRALINNTSGEGNTALGFRTLDTNTIQGYNTAIGSEALRNNNATGNTAIGRQAGLNISTGANNTLIGRNAGDSITDGIGNVVVGFTAYQAGSNDYNTVVGYQAGYGANSSNTVYIGFRAGYLNTGTANTYIGNEAGRFNTSGISNVFIGADAGYSNTTNSSNTYVGTQAGVYQTGIYNTSLGHLAMGGTSGTGTGQQNTAIGHQAGRYITNANQTTYVGRNAGLYTTTGQYNTGIGSASLQTCTIGAANTAIGLNALFSLTDGNNNTTLGLNSGYGVTTGLNNLLLGANAGRSTGSGGLGEIISGDNQIQLGNNTNTSFKCKIALTVTSDKRDKTNFKEIPLGLDFVSQLKPTSFEFKKERESNEADGIERYGFFAQDILELEGDNPVIIDNEDKENLKYTNGYLIPVLVKAIQELKAEVDLLKQECKCKN